MHLLLGHGANILHQEDGKCQELILDASTSSKQTKLIRINEIVQNLPHHLSKAVLQFHALTGEKNNIISKTIESVLCFFPSHHEFFSTNFRWQYLENGLSDLLENWCAKSSHWPLLAHRISSESDKPFSEILPSEVSPVFGSGLGSVIGPVMVRRYVWPELPVWSGIRPDQRGEVRRSGRTSILGVRLFSRQRDLHYMRLDMCRLLLMYCL